MDRIKHESATTAWLSSQIQIRELTSFLFSNGNELLCIRIIEYRLHLIYGCIVGIITLLVYFNMAITSILAHQLISEIEINLLHPITTAYQCKEWDESFKHKYIFKIHLKIHSSCVLVKSFAFLFLVSLYNYDLFKCASVTTKLHCISAYKLNQPQRKICKVISGTLKAKFSNKVLSKFQQRYVELIYVEKKLNQNVTTGHYEMRLYKNNNKSIKSSKDLFCFKINPMSMTFYANNITSDKHPFTFSYTFHKFYCKKTLWNINSFICSSNGISICFSVHTKYECNGWISVLQQLIIRNVIILYFIPKWKEFTLFI